ncbi:MAG: ClbS/DfsB family four-helix bundle protein [Chloroflexi bacterium]|nr:ClbS/DfsB family four-helix bundle protein [Chloroflexota bacterium]
MKVTEIATKKDLMAEFQAERQKLAQLLAGLSEDQMVQPGVCEGWSVKDILAHVTVWEQMVLGWYRAGRRGENPKTPADDLKWSETPILNQRIYEQYRDTPLAEIRAQYETTHQAMIETVQTMSEEELFTPKFYAWTNTTLLFRYVWSSTGAHFNWARTEIRKWIKAQSAS